MWLSRTVKPWIIAAAGVFFGLRAVLVVLQCDNRGCNSKGKRVTVRRGNHPAHVLGLKSQASFTRARARGTQGFSSEKFTKVDRSWKSPRLKSLRQPLPRKATPPAPRTS